jgi:hypothetical protein
VKYLGANWANLPKIHGRFNGGALERLTREVKTNILFFATFFTWQK